MTSGNHIWNSTFPNFMIKEIWIVIISICIFLKNNSSFSIIKIEKIIIVEARA